MRLKLGRFCCKAGRQNCAGVRASPPSGRVVCACHQLVEAREKKAAASAAVQDANETLNNVIRSQQAMLPALRKDIEGVEAELRASLTQQAELEVLYGHTQLIVGICTALLCVCVCVCACVLCVLCVVVMVVMVVCVLRVCVVCAYTMNFSSRPPFP